MKMKTILIGLGIAMAACAAVIYAGHRRTLAAELSAASEAMVSASAEAYAWRGVDDDWIRKTTENQLAFAMKETAHCREMMETAPDERALALATVDYQEAKAEEARITAELEEIDAKGKAIQERLDAAGKAVLKAKQAAGEE